MVTCLFGNVCSAMPPWWLDVSSLNHQQVDTIWVSCLKSVYQFKDRSEIWDPCFPDSWPSWRFCLPNTSRCSDWNLHIALKWHSQQVEDFSWKEFLDLVSKKKQSPSTIWNSCHSRGLFESTLNCSHSCWEWVGTGKNFVYPSTSEACTMHPCSYELLLKWAVKRAAQWTVVEVVVLETYKDRGSCELWSAQAHEVSSTIRHSFNINAERSLHERGEKANALSKSCYCLS